MKSINGGKLERKGLLLEEDNEDFNSGFDGDNTLLHRPESASNSSSSELEEEFHSDSATEKDKDEELEGIRSLFGVYDHLVEDNQESLVQGNRCESVQSLSLANAPSLVQEGEIQKEGDQTLKADSNLGNEERKKVQDILTQLGLRLIPKNDKTPFQGSSNGTSRRKGIREPQNLKFNVNYDRGGCSRGTHSPP